MPRSFIIIFILALSFNCIGQIERDSIHVIKKGHKFTYFQHDRKLSLLDIKKIVEVDSEAEKYIKSANLNRIFANVFIGIGTITFCYGALAEIESGDKSKIQSSLLTGLIVGGTIAALAIPFRFSAKKQTKMAVKTYNRSLKTSVNITITPYGIGLILNL